MTASDTESARSAQRDAATVTGWNLASRLTGFARVLAIGGALGATRLGDTYQAANQVSNILFEFLAAGTLSAVLVPGLVARIANGARDDARAFADALLARALAVLAPVAVLGALFAHPIMRLFFAANDSGSRAAQVRLGAILLLFVLPQLLLYAWGAVVTAMLHADGRFAAAAAAPVANNVIVTTSLVLFWIHGTTGLRLGVSDQWLLGGGVLGGVLCMTTVPAAAAARAGLAVMPRWHRSDAIRASFGAIGWASLVVIPEQLFLLASLIVAGRVTGGVVACQIAFTLFLLPHALLGQPLATVLYPRLATAWANGDRAAARAIGAHGLLTTLMLTAPAATLMAALAPWLVRVISVGALGHGAGVSLVAAALGGYGVGLFAYSWWLLVTRIAYASGDVRTPGVVGLLAGVAGTVSLFLLTGASDSTTVRWIGLCHTMMMFAAAAALITLLARRGAVVVDVRRWTTPVVAAAVAALGARVVANGLGAGGTRIGALAVGGTAGVLGLAIYIAALWIGGIRRWPSLDPAP